VFTPKSRFPAFVLPSAFFPRHSQAPTNVTSKHDPLFQITVCISPFFFICVLLYHRQIGPPRTPTMQVFSPLLEFFTAAYSASLYSLVHTSYVSPFFFPVWFESFDSFPPALPSLIAPQKIHFLVPVRGPNHFFPSFESLQVLRADSPLLPSPFSAQDVEPFFCELGVEKFPANVSPTTCHLPPPPLLSAPQTSPLPTVVRTLR